MENQPKKRRGVDELGFIVKMVEYTEPVFIGIGIAYAVTVVTLLISFSHKFP